MRKHLNISAVILTIIRDNPERDFALDELTALIFPDSPPQDEKRNQSEVLDMLIFLDDQKLVLLDFDTDRSSIAK